MSDYSKRDRLPPVSLAYLMTYGTCQIFCFSSTIWRSLAEKSSSVMENGTVSVRTRTGEDLGAMTLADFSAKLRQIVDTKAKQ